MLDRVRAVITSLSANALNVDTDSQVWQGEKKWGMVVVKDITLGLIHFWFSVERRTKRSTEKGGGSWGWWLKCSTVLIWFSIFFLST